MAQTLWVVRRRRGGPWDWSRDMREQDGWDVVEAPSAEAIHARLAEDNWTKDGKLETVSVERWTILLDGRSR
jgi:hypothetical protein